MGADIHMYVEYSNKEKPEHLDRRYWSDFGGRINPGRNYSMFGLIAGVRDNRHPPVVEPRGLPDDLSWPASNDASMIISDDCQDEEGYTSSSQAESWVKAGYSEYILDHEGEPYRVTNPDWHSHTWLTPDEFGQAIERYKELFKDDTYGNCPGIEYIALLAAMRALENDGKNDVRVVIWFDN